MKMSTIQAISYFIQYQTGHEPDYSKPHRTFSGAVRHLSSARFAARKGGDKQRIWIVAERPGHASVELTAAQEREMDAI